MPVVGLRGYLIKNPTPRTDEPDLLENVSAQIRTKMESMNLNDFLKAELEGCLDLNFVADHQRSYRSLNRNQI